MDLNEVLELIELGETSKVQFKRTFSGPSQIAAEIGAFANAKGGKILIGVEDDGVLAGLSREEIKALNQKISNVCINNINPSISVYIDTIKYQENKFVMIIDVPMGTNKFYMSNGQDVWIKVGADKRKAGREELKRLLQESGNVYADEEVVRETSIDDLNRIKIDKFLKRRFDEEIGSMELSINQVLNNMRLMSQENCTLAGLILFGDTVNPVMYRISVKAVSWYGNDLAGIDYRDSEDIVGDVDTIYKESMAFIKRQLRKVQGGQNFNTVGILELPEVALQEAIINAIVHRNYFVMSTIKIMVFDNRLEIVSPGVLPNTLSIAAIKSGVHLPRNPIVLSHIKDIAGIPFRGMGTGIARIISECKKQNIKVEFINDELTNQFKVIFYRPHPPNLPLH